MFKKYLLTDFQFLSVPILGPLKYNYFFKRPKNVDSHLAFRLFQDS